MAQIAMGAVGAGVGAFFGNPMLGFSVGMTVGGLLFPPKGPHPGHGGMDDLRVSGSGYGVPIPQIFGKGRVAGNIIWARDIVEHKQSKRVGGKLSGQTTQEFVYTASFAVAICRGPIERVRRIWADDVLIFDADFGTGEQQTITVGTNTGGDFDVTFRGSTTGTIPWNTTTANLLAELEGLLSIGVGQISLSGPDGGPWTATFTGTLANENVPRMDMSDGTLTGGHGEGIRTLSQGSTYVITTYAGDETQVADPLIESFQGIGETPAYRGLAYAVFTNLDLTKWGNRIPSFTFEVDLDGGTITLGDIVANLFEQGGITSFQYDVGAGTTEIRGFLLTQRQSIAQQLEPLLNSYFYDLSEFDGIINLVARGGAAIKTIPAGDLAAWTRSGGSGTAPNPTSRVTTRRRQDIELPQRIELSYMAANANYLIRTIASALPSKTHQQKKLIAVPLALTEFEARNIVEKTMDQHWVEREGFEIVCPLSYLIYTAADIFELPVGDNLLRVRVTKQDAPFFGAVRFSLVLDDEDILTQVADGDEATEPTAVVQAIETTFVPWTGNAIKDPDTLHTGIYGVAYGPTGEFWPGATLYWSRDDGDTYQELKVVESAGAAGYVNGTVPAPAAVTWDSDWDDITVITVIMEAGEPFSVTDADVLVGENYALVGNEIIQFVTATPTINPNEYELTRLLRGQRGTDGYMTTHEDGEKFVLLSDSALVRVDLDESARGKDVILKCVTAGSTLAATGEQDLTISGDEWKCYSSCQGAGTRLVGDLTVTWNGRTRSGGELHDWTDVDDPDLPESYEVEVWDSTYTTLKRTITGLSTPTTTYSAADQTTDFGSPQSSVYLTIYRLGRYGRGYPYNVTV